MESLDSSLLALPDEDVEPEKLPIIGPKLAKLAKEEDPDRIEALALGISARKAYNKLSGKLTHKVRYALLLFIVRIERLIGAQVPIDPS